jgi:hypothetical protein
VSLTTKNIAQPPTFLVRSVSLTTKNIAQPPTFRVRSVSYFLKSWWSFELSS